MTDDLLTEFRSAVPLPDEATAKRVYAEATTGRRPLPRRWLVPAIAVAGAVCLAGVIAVIALPHANRGDTTGPPVAHGEIPIMLPLDRALNEASQSFGVPVFLPDTPLLKPSDADPDASMQWLPSPKPGMHEPVSQLSIGFSAASASIEYAPTAYAGGSEYPNALDQYKAEIAQTPNHPVDGRTPPDLEIVYLRDGTPALVHMGSTGNGIEFRVGPLSISIWAGRPASVGPTGSPRAAPAFGANDLQELAQSIVDQSASS